MTDNDTPLGKLSQTDVEALMNDPSVERKTELVGKLSGQYSNRDFTDSQLELAEQIFRLLLQEADVEVRRALSESLVECSTVPKDIVLSLSRDVKEVACPMLEFSQVLNDEDLIELIKSTENAAHQLAVARRQGVSERVSDALIETKNETVVKGLMGNQTAQISEKGMEKVTETFASSQDILESMISRGGLSQNIIKKITSKASVILKEMLEQKYSREFSEIGDFFRESGEMAAIKFMGQQSIDDDLMELIDTLEYSGDLEAELDPENGQLAQLLDGLDQLGQITPLSTLACGHLTLFKISMSRMTGVNYQNVNQLVRDGEGLKKLYEAAGLPNMMFDAVKLCVDVMVQMKKEAPVQNTPRALSSLYQMDRRITEAAKGKNVKNLPHLVAMIHHHINSKLGEW